VRSRIALVAAAFVGSAGLLAADGQAPARQPKPATTIRLTATAYCDHGTTQSGVRTRTGIVAADPRILPVGSVVRIVDGATTGIYTVMDTGSAIKGRKLDIFIPDCQQARAFGERPVRLRVLRRGWDPRASASETGR
jgi:3D (Asp-Asp-Asp) domain-containing protein